MITGLPKGMQKATLALVALISLSFAAQAQTMKSGSSTAASTSTSTTAAGGTAATPTDAQLMHIFETANQIDVDGGKMAASKAKHKDVKKFAAEMVTDHTAANAKAKVLQKKIKLTPEENSTSQSLKKAADENTAKLKSLSGADFDKAYIDNEVAVHQQVLDALDKTLIPDAKNADLKALFEKTRPTIQAHLEHAQKVQSSLSK